MTNSNAASGKKYETDLIAYANSTHPILGAHRPAQRSFSDRGDIRLSTAVLQAKHYSTGTKTIARHLADVALQASQHRTSVPLLPIAVVSTSSTIADDLAVMRLSDVLALLAERDRLDDIVHRPERISE